MSENAENKPTENTQDQIPVAAPEPFGSKETAKQKTIKAVLLKKAHNISVFCTDDESRYVLMGVHYNAAKQRMEATDGRMLIYVLLSPELDVDNFPPVNVPHFGDLKDCVIPKKVLSDAFRVLENRRITLPVLESVLFSGGMEDKGSYKASLTTTDLDSDKTETTKVIDGDYPNVEQVIPSGPYKESITLSPILLGKICDYAIANQGGSVNGIKIELNGPLEPVRITIPTNDGVTAHVVLMPLRLS